MVRYSAPHQDDTSTPMEWTPISDDGDDDYYHETRHEHRRLSSSQSRRHRHDNACRSLVSYEHPRDSDEGDIWRYNDGDDPFVHARHGEESSHVHRCADESSSSPIPASHEWHRGLQTVYEGYHGELERYWKQQQYERRRRRRRFAVIGTIVAIIALVLYNYAPPPPPVRIILPESFAKEFEADVPSIIDFEASFYNRLDSNSHSQRGDTQQRYHDSWGKYSQHTFQLFTDAFLHQLYVAWYAVSNAFSYASQEVRLVLVDFLGRKIPNRSAPSSTPKREETTPRRSAHSAMSNTAQCPIRLPAASNRRISLPRGADPPSSANTERPSQDSSTEEFLRQSIGASLSPQNLALMLLAEGIDSWGRSSVETAPLSSVDRMSAAAETGYWIRDGKDGGFPHSWILPPALGMLLVGPEGVGKLHTARLLGRWLFGHCDGMEEGRDGDGDFSDGVCSPPWTEESQPYCSNDRVHTHPENRRRDLRSILKETNGVLEIMAEGYAFRQNSDSTNTNHAHPVKEMIVNHIMRRQHSGSVIITHHMEALSLSLLSELSSVITGKSEHLSYTAPDGTEVSACTNGTVFVFTSKQWGTKSIFEEIQKNGMRVRGLRRESLLSSVRWEVDSHFEYWDRMASQLTVAPFLPFQQEDLKSILRNEVYLFNKKYQDLHWKRLHLSNSAFNYFLSTDHVEYFDLFGKDHDPSTALTFSLRGATSLEENALVRALRTKLTSGTRKRPYKVASVDVTALNDEEWETVLLWCEDDESGRLMDCEVEWRLVLN